MATSILTKFKRARENIANWPAVILYALPISRSAKLYFRQVSFQHDASPYKAPITVTKHDQTISFDYKNKNVKFYYDSLAQLGNTGLLLKGAFFDKEYSQMDPNGEVLIDIGGNVGDTAVYFALEGASKVYMFEPFPYSCRIAEKNVAFNGLQDKVQIVNAGCGAKSLKVLIDPNFRNDGASEIPVEAKDGVVVKMYTLDEIISEFKLESYALKVDCEGCEVGLIRGASDATLKKCKKFIMESTAPDRETVVDRLKSLGFKISIAEEHPVIVYAEQ